MLGDITNQYMKALNAEHTFQGRRNREGLERSTLLSKVIREKSRGEGSLIVQGTIENVSEPKFFFKLFKKKKCFF